MTTTYNRISKKIDDSYVVWFEENNQWVFFEEPAFFVYNLYSKNKSANSISVKVSERYNLSEKKAFSFVNEIIEGINKLLIIKKVPLQKNEILNLCENIPTSFFSCHSYKINNVIIKICYETILLGFYFHPYFKHLEVTNADNYPTIEFEIFNDKQNHVLRLKNNIEKCWIFNDISILKRKLFIQILNKVYKKDDEYWMTFLHASGVTNGKETILFSSDSGSGKSTLSALLFKKGFEIVSDDFVALDINHKQAFPFPAAISVKEKAFSLFPSESLTELRYENLKNKSAKFLDPEIPGKSWYKPHKVIKIVFVKYNPKVKFKFTKVHVPEALRLFYEQASIITSYENTKRFINWFVKAKCYKLEYSDTDQALHAIIGLFTDS